MCSVSLRILVYFGLLPAEFDLCLQMKSRFLVRAILDRLSCEDSSSCFWTGSDFLSCCWCFVVVLTRELIVDSLTTRQMQTYNLITSLQWEFYIFFKTFRVIPLTDGAIVTDANFLFQEFSHVLPQLSIWLILFLKFKFLYSTVNLLYWQMSFSN